MLYGYMFLRNSFLFNTKVRDTELFIISLCLCISVFTKILHVGCEARGSEGRRCRLRGAKPRAPWVEGTGFKTLGDNP